MRAPLAWLLGALGLAALLRRLLARPTLPRVTSPPAATPAEPEAEAADPRADELRRKLAEARSLVDEQVEFEGAETRVDEAEPTGADLAERRRAVHAEGRAAAEQMRSTEAE